MKKNFVDLSFPGAPKAYWFQTNFLLTESPRSDLRYLETSGKLGTLSVSSTEEEGGWARVPLRSRPHRLSHLFALLCPPSCHPCPVLSSCLRFLLPHFPPLTLSLILFLFLFLSIPRCLSPISVLPALSALGFSAFLLSPFSFLPSLLGSSPS